MQAPWVLVPPAGCRIFVLHVDYSRLFPALQVLSRKERHSLPRNLTKNGEYDKIKTPQMGRERCATERRLAKFLQNGAPAKSSDFVGRGRTNGTEGSLPAGRDSHSAVCSDELAVVIFGVINAITKK